MGTTDTRQTQQVNLGSRDMAAGGDAPAPVSQAARTPGASRGHVADRQLTYEAGTPRPHVETLPSPRASQPAQEAGTAC